MVTPGVSQGSGTPGDPLGAAAGSQPPDQEVVAAVLAGETEQFALLVGRHQEALYRQALSMGLDNDTAGDLVQDAFVRAFEGLGGWQERFRSRRPPGPLGGKKNPQPKGWSHEPLVSCRGGHWRRPRRHHRL